MDPQAPEAFFLVLFVEVDKRRLDQIAARHDADQLQRLGQPFETVHRKPRCDEPAGFTGQGKRGGAAQHVGETQVERLVSLVGDSKIDLGDVKGAFEGLQFGTVHLGETGKHLLARFQQMNLDLPAVHLTDLSANEIERLTAGHERDYAVMLRLEPFRKLADGRPVALRIALDVQEQQILQWRDAFALGGLFRKSLEAPHLVAKLGQLLEVRLGQATSEGFHRSSVEKIGKA
jgi:hypothetical protein